VSWTDRNLNQAAVYRELRGVDRYGEPLVAGPVEIAVRFERRKREVRKADGTVIGLDATMMVDREVKVGSTVSLGTLDDWLGTGSAGEESELYQVVTYGEVPDVRGLHLQRTAGLARFRDAAATEA
jgi:hypothetical protein